MPNRSAPPAPPARPATLALAAAAGLAPLAAPSLAQTGPLEEPFPAVLQLADLNGDLGVRLDGSDVQEGAGYTLAAIGDVNGDGVDDVAIGAGGVDALGRTNAGACYVVFGRADGGGGGGGVGGGSATLTLAALDGTNGFAIVGEATNDRLRFPAAAGDVNGDGIGDVLVGSRDAHRIARGDTGAAYVVFGRVAGHAFEPVVDLAALDGITGFRMQGAQDNDWTGEAVARAGDVNGDGVDDVIIGARNADPSGRSGAGVSYVVFGRAAGGFAASMALDELNGADGFVVVGAANSDASGKSVAGAGDVNGDGVDDFLVGAPQADPPAGINGGMAYLVFGRAGGFPASLDLALLGGDAGVRFEGAQQAETAGWVVDGGRDVNGDGRPDVLISAFQSVADGEPGAGAAYVVFGPDAGEPLAAVVPLADLDGRRGVRLEGGGRNDNAGRGAALLDDVNGDGVDDILVGAPYADPGGRLDAGSSYVVFGRQDGEAFPAMLGLADLDGHEGFRLDGVVGGEPFGAPGDQSGQTVSRAGDANGDGVGDMLISANRADPGGQDAAGSAYLVYGRRPIACRADFDGDGRLTIMDFLAFQMAFLDGDLAADFDADGRLNIFDFLVFQNEFLAGCP